jgi:hypothetical protein
MAPALLFSHGLKRAGAQKIRSNLGNRSCRNPVPREGDSRRATQGHAGYRIRPHPRRRNSNQPVERQRLFNRFGGKVERTEPARQSLRTRFTDGRAVLEALIFIEENDFRSLT